MATLTVTTACDGGSLLRVDLNNTTGVERVRIRLSRPDLGEDLLDTRPSGDGGWVLDGNEVALPGNWQAVVIARRTNIFDDAQAVSDSPSTPLQARRSSRQLRAGQPTSSRYSTPNKGEPSMSRLRSLVAAGLSIFALVVSTGVASAHAQYQSSTPPANATVQATPNAVQVTWTQELASIQFTITAPDGSTNVVNGPATIDLAQRHNASVPIRDAGPGMYLVLWHNVSGDDGDPNDGSFAFNVAGTPPPAAAAPAPTTNNAQPAAAAQPVSSAPVCVDNGQITPGQADFRVNTYCKRQMIRLQYKGKINELVFNYDLSIGMGLENSLKDAMGGGGG